MRFKFETPGGPEGIDPTTGEDRDLNEIGDSTALDYIDPSFVVPGPEDRDTKREDEVLFGSDEEERMNEKTRADYQNTPDSQDTTPLGEAKDPAKIPMVGGSHENKEEPPYGSAEKDSKRGEQKYRYKNKRRA